jgi:hypothetical protein
MSKLFGIMIALILIAIAGMATPVYAGKKTLSGTYGEGQVGNDCINANGTFTTGTGPDGYGCKTKGGEVSCTSAGKCTGTCGNCIRSSPPKGGLLGPTIASKGSVAAPVKPTTLTPMRPAFAGGFGAAHGMGATGRGHR